MSSVFTSEIRFPVLGSRAACWSVSTSLEDHLCFPCSWDQSFQHKHSLSFFPSHVSSIACFLPPE
uniref:Putative ovule protein n=1 Tax=Solanum chacoense TaxID=4108 RepID=A0A0V0GR80_SOLCH